MVKMLNLLLYGRDNLHSRAPSTNNRYSLIGEVVSFFVIGRVHELAFEVFQTWYLWPLPVVQYASGVDEELGTVFKHASASNSVFGLVLGVIASIYLEAVVVVFCVELNVVRARRLYPRALLTPFTDNVELTEGDKNSYTGQAEAQRNKGFQDITVTYDEPNSVVDEDSSSTRGD